MAAQANKFVTPGYAYTLSGEPESYTLPGSEDLSRKFEQLLQEGERTSNELLSTLPLSRYSSTLSAPPFPSLPKNQFTSSASLSSGSSSTCRQNAPVSGSAEKCNAQNSVPDIISLPHMVAHFDESPWVWRSADTSPLKLSDMQPRLLTPESIRRQRSHCVRLIDKNNPSTSPTHSCGSSGQSRGTYNSANLFNLTQSTLRSNATIKPRNHAVSQSQEAEGVAPGQLPDSPTRRQLELTSRTDSNALISCNSAFGQSSEPASLAASCTDGSLLTATRLRFSSIASYDTIKLGADSCSNTTSTRIRKSIKASTEAEKCVASLPHFNQSPDTTWLKPPFLVMEKIEDDGVNSSLNVSAVSAGFLSGRQSAHSTGQSASEVPAEIRSPDSFHNAYFGKTSEHRQPLLPRRDLADGEQQKRKRQHSRSKVDSSFVVTNQGDFSDTGASDSVCFERASQKTDCLSRRRRHSFATENLSTSPFPQRAKSLSSDDTRSISSTIDPKAHQRALSYGPSVDQSELARRLAFVPPAALDCRNKTPFPSRQISSVSRVEIADAASARPTSSSATTVDFAQTERDNSGAVEPCLAFQKKQNANSALFEAGSLDLSLSNAQKSSMMSFSLRDSPYATSHSTSFVPADDTPSCIAIEVARLRRLCRQKVNRAGRRKLRDSAFGSPEDAGASKTPFGSSDATPSQMQTGSSDFTSGPRLFEQSGSVKTKRAYASSNTLASNPEIIQRPSARHYVDSRMRSTLNFQGREMTMSNFAAQAPVIERQLSKTPMPSHTSASASSASSVVTRQEYERLMERTYSGINTDTLRSTFVSTAAAEKTTTHRSKNTVVMKSFNQDGYCFESLPMNHCNSKRQDAYPNASSIVASSKLSCANNASSENIVTQGKSDANTVAKESITLQNETKAFSKTDFDTTSQKCFEIPTGLTATASNVDASASSHLTEISMSVPTFTSNLPSFDTLNSTVAYDTPTPMTSDNGIVTTTASACFPSSSFSFELTAADFNTGENTLHFSNLATPYAIVYKAQKDKKTFAQGPTPDPHFPSGCNDRKHFVNRRLPENNLFHWKSSPSVYEKQSSGRDSRLTLRQDPYADFSLAQSHQEDDDLITPYPVRDSNNVSVSALKPLSPVQSDGAKKSSSLVSSELNCFEEQHRTVQNASPPTAQETAFDNSHHDPQPKKRHYGWRLRRPRPYVVLNVLRRTRYPLIALRQDKRSATRGSLPKVQASNAIPDEAKPSFSGDSTVSAQLSPNKTESTKPDTKSSYVTSNSEANAHVSNEGLVSAAEKVSTADEPHSFPGAPFASKSYETNKEQTRKGCDLRNGTSTSLPCSSHLSAQWLRLNQKLREHGISKIGVPILDSDISRVYGDAFVQLEAERPNKTCNQNLEFLNSTKLRLLPQNSSKNASLDISLVTQNDMAQHRIDTAASKEQRTQDGVSVLQPVGTKPVKSDSQKNVNDSLELQDENFPAPYDDTIALLLANIDIVKMLDLWNKTLDELTKYRQYCSDLYQFEGSHLRIFQQNDTLKKENDALKAKVCSLERLLQQSRTSEVEHWESQVDYQQMEIEKERLMKSLKVERQKMKVLIVQKRQSDIAVNNLKQQIHRLLEKENRIRIKAKTVLEKVARGLRPTSSHNAQGAAANCRAAAAGGAPGPTAHARQSNSRGASFSALASEGPRQLPKLNAETCVNHGVVELVWYYEEQLDTLNLEKGELSNAVMSAKKTLRRHGLSPNLRSRQGRLSTEQQSSTGLLSVDENAKKQSPEKDRQNLSSLVPFAETLTTTATTACSKHVPQDTTLSATDACEARKTFAVECESCPLQPIHPMSANAASPPRWILSELHAQLKSTIEEKTKNELRYQDEIDHLREALKRATSPLSESHISDCNVTSQTVSENGSVERNCESIIAGFSSGLGTRELIRRDKKLFRAGLQERLKELERKGRLFNLLESSCRSLSLDDPQRLPEVAERLVAAVSVTKQLQSFVQNLSRILGASFLYEQHKFAEIERLLYKWRDALVHMDITAALHRNFAALLERVVACTHTTLGAWLVDALRTGVKQALGSTSHLRDANEKQLNEVLALALSALERQQNTTTDTPPCLLEAKSASAQPVVENCVNEKTLIESQQFLANATTQTLQDILLYFMQVFKVPTLELCRPAVDRLHLKIKEHIRFYRGVVTVLNVPLDTPPSEILKHIAHINNRASTTHDMIKEQVYRELLESSHISLPMKEVKHLFKVFRAIQVRLSLPDVPSTCLGDLFVMAGDEGIVEDPVLEQHNSRQALTTAAELHSTDEGCCDTSKEPTGLLVSSSSSSGSLLSSSITGKRSPSWKKWAKVCLFTIDLMARMVEQSRWAMVPNAYRSRDIVSHNGLPHAQCSRAGAVMRPCVK